MTNDQIYRRAKTIIKHLENEEDKSILQQVLELNKHYARMSASYKANLEKMEKKKSIYCRWNRPEDVPEVLGPFIVRHRVDENHIKKVEVYVADYREGQWVTKEGPIEIDGWIKMPQYWD